MSFIRAPRPENGWTAIANGALRDRRLSYKARGILACILSLPPGAEVNEEKLADASDPDGTTAVRSGLRELRDAGYIVRTQTHDAKGHLTTVTYVYDVPQNTHQSSGKSPSRGKPATRATRDAGKPRATTKTPYSSESVTSPELPLELNEEDLSVANATEREQEEPPEMVVARGVYEHAGRMVPFMGMRNIARQALKRPGMTPERVLEAMIAVYDSGRTPTLVTVGQRLDGKSPDANGAAAKAPSVWDMEEYVD